MVKYRYIAHHVPTNKRFVKEAEVTDFEMLLRKLNFWNSTGHPTNRVGDWVYYTFFAEVE